LGTSASVVGGSLTIAGGVLTVTTGGLAAPLLVNDLLQSFSLQSERLDPKCFSEQIMILKNLIFNLKFESYPLLIEN
jgi:hypothetical protein